jgi:hypothetical protein
MAVRFDCPSCKANYEVADDLAGKTIMCRVCKKRGSVRSLSAAASALAMPAASAAAGSVSRRNFLPWAGLFLASLGAIGVGALLANPPWERGKLSPEEEERRRRFRERQLEDKKDGDKKDGKGGPA